MDHLVADARRELTVKLREDIEQETAWKWAARAIAAYEASRMTDDRNASRLERDAQDYYHEAVEHAAQADRTGTVLQAVRDWVDQRVPIGAI